MNKLRFLNIFVENFLQTLIQKRLNQLKKHVYIKIIKTPLISSIVHIFVEKNFTNFYIKKVKSTEKTCLY